MTSSLGRGLLLLSYVFFMENHSGSKNLRTVSDKYRLGGILPDRGAFVPKSPARFVRSANCHQTPSAKPSCFQPLPRKSNFSKKIQTPISRKPEVGMARLCHHQVGVVGYYNRWKYGGPRPFRSRAIRVLRFCQMSHRGSENGFQMAIQPKPKVEFRRRPADLTQRLRFPIRVHIH